MGFVRRKLAITKKGNDKINFFLGQPCKSPFTGINIKSEDWFAVREIVLLEWAMENPGTRPQGWWQFEAPEAKRKKLSGNGKLYPALECEKNYRYNKGIPGLWCYAEKPTIPLTFEPEAEYLRRNDLFHENEAERLTKKDYEPEAVG